MEKEKKDFEDFLEALNKNLVEYCIVGAYAVGYHAEPRNTKDIDIMVRDTKENAEKILKAINDFGFGSLNIKIDDLTAKDTIIQLGYAPNRIDILTSIAGVEFDEIWKNKENGKLGIAKTYFMGLNELIKSKEASKERRERKEDMYKDMHVIEVLKRVRTLKYSRER